MHNNKSLESLITKIDAFIRIYYKNRMIKGIIYSIALLVFFFLLVNLLEYFSYFGRTTRAVMFFGYILLTLIITGVYIVTPILKLFKIGKRISYEQAADIISKHFPEVGDKLVNTLQLGSMVQLASFNTEMIDAAILQKTERIKHVPFTDAIDKKDNVRKVPYALIPLSILIALLIASPTIIEEPTKRLSNYHLEYERPMPFAFNISHNNFNVVKGDDLDLNIQVNGTELPAEVSVEYGGKSSRAVKLTNNEFTYRFRNLNEDIYFKLSSGKFTSESYQIKVLPRPVIISYETYLEYPDYVGRASEKFRNTGDFSLPAGTNITWFFNTETVDSIISKRSDEIPFATVKKSENHFESTTMALNSFDYVIIPVNRNTAPNDSLLHQVTVIPDLYPEIQVETIIDSLNSRKAYFTGLIKDDYGFTRLQFHFKRRNVKASEKPVDSDIRLISIDKTTNYQSFFYNLDFNDLLAQPGDRIEYWFEIWDNDEVNGSKSSRSSIGAIEFPDIRESEQQISEKQSDVADEMNEIQSALKELTQEIDQLQRSILQKESISWEDTNKLREMLERQLNLQQRVEKLKDDHIELNRLQEKINPYNEEIVRKQNELQKLFEEIMSDEMKEMFEELQKLINELDRSKMQETLEKMQLSNEELVRNLDRNLELFKQLEMEKMITDAIAKLNKLAEEQDQLANQTDDPGSDSSELDQKQEQIAEEFDNIKEDLKNVKDKNEDLERKFELPNTREIEKDIENSMNQSRKNLKEDQKPTAIPHQRNASGQMRMMSQNLMDMMASMQDEQLGEDIKVIRKLLEDLIDISFDLEDLVENTLKTSRIDPRFNELLSEQKRLIISLGQVEDSLNAIAKRQISVQQFVLREIAQINFNIEEALQTLEERNINAATSRQQFVMTSVNNLALMLSEAMEQMMNQMNSSSSEGASCPMPGQGQGKPSMSNMKDLQQQLNQQLEQMKKSMSKPGESGMPQQGGQSMSEQLARMAAQQEAIRRQMQQYLEEFRKETGSSDGNALEAMEEMEKTEKDLVNKRISEETLFRQEKIMSRLLESERAELERDKEERRESRQAENYPTTDPDSILEFYRKKMNEREMLRTLPPQMNSFYRMKTNKYFIQVQ